MRKAASSLKSTRFGATFLLAIILAARPVSGEEVLANSSKECAICHIRWVRVFDRSEPQASPMQAVMERQAGSGDMCLSCHDGSVTDSRFKVWATRHHATDTVPSPAVSIPTEKFPLDAQGRMTCATCHTAHAVPGDSDLRTVIFLRQPNVDSSLCLACHPEHAQKSDRQHPLGPHESPVPTVILEAGGKTSPDGHTILCQTCHEPHGARNPWMLVLPPSELCIACHASKAPETSPPAGAPVHHIGRTYAGFEPPTTLLNERATFGPNGELSCLSCHRLHDASGARPLLIRKNEDSSLCIECHKKETAVLGSPHDLRVSSPESTNAQGEKASVSGPCGACHRIHGWARDVPETDRPHSSGCMECHGPAGPGSRHRPYVEAHPVGVPVPEGASVPLPLDAASKAIGCLTCHDPHLPHPSRDAVMGSTGLAEPLQQQADSPRTPRSFLRQEGSRLCVLCHDKMADSLQGPHDPARLTPALRQTLGLHPSAGSCRSCHTAHSAQGLHLWARAPADSSKGFISDFCSACHDGDFVKQPQGTHHPLGTVSSSRVRTTHHSFLPRPSGAVRGTHPTTEISCIDCHDPHGGAQPAAQLRRPAESLCSDCHEDKEAIKGSVHDPGANEWGKDPNFVAQSLCLNCHPIHGPKNQDGIRRLLGSEPAAGNLCEACHRSGKPGTVVKTPHVGKALLNNPEDPMSKQAATPDERILCTTCHDIHKNAQGSKLLRAARGDSSLCLACHAEFGGLLDTAHNLSKSAPRSHNLRGESPAESGPCGSCHVVHPASVESGTWARGLPSEDKYGRGLCTGCHRSGECAAGRIPEQVDHPDVVLLNRLLPGSPDYMPTFDERGGPSPTGVISCPTCHQLHATRPALAPGKEPPASTHMFLRTAHQTLCTDCHGVEALWRFLYYHKANRNPSRHSLPETAESPLQ